MQLTALGSHGSGQDRLPGPLHDVIPVTRKPGKRNIRNQLGGERRHREDAWRITTRTPLHTVSAERRHVFTTEAVAAGLPVHIAAKLLGHRDLNTTQGYVAIYQDDILRHHAAFIARRRTERPSEEYRQPTAAEWAEFDRHFARRKVELGTCSRPYGTPCRHEHACLRCPMLQPDPGQAQRLTEIIASLRERLREARERGWLGEAEGLQVSLTAARQKLQQMRQTRSRIPIQISPRRP
jgi:hypothetical protein